MYWRRFRTSAIPLDSAAEFDKWLRERWDEKDLLLETHARTGRFPGFDAGGKGGHVVTRVRLGAWWEVGGIFAVVGPLVGVGWWAWWG